MKIMMVHHYGGLGGGTSSCFDICRMLLDSKHEVVLVIPTPCEALCEIADKTGVKLIKTSVGVVSCGYHNAGSGIIKSIAKYGISLHNQAYWKELFHREGPEMVILNSSVQGPMVKIAHQMGIRTICFVRETFRETGSKRWNSFIGNLLGKADGVAFLTEYDMKAWAIPGRGKQCVIPDIVDTERLMTLSSTFEWSEKRIPPNARCVLYLGGINEEKGALELLQAFSICAKKDPNLYLLILGNVDETVYQRNSVLSRWQHRKAYRYFLQCKRELSALEKAFGRVISVGLVSNVTPWYQRADVVVFPVKKVHQARPVYEAGYYYKPIIVPNFEHFQHSVIDGYNGVVYQRDDVEMMADRILELVNDDSLRARMGENNHRMFNDYHTYRAVKLKLDAFLSAVMI